MCYHPSNQHIRVNPYSTYHPSPRQPSRQTEGLSNLILGIHYGFLGWQANKWDYCEYSIPTLHSEIGSWLQVRELRGIMDCRCVKSIDSTKGLGVWPEPRSIGWMGCSIRTHCNILKSCMRIDVESLSLFHHLAVLRLSWSKRSNT